MDVPTAMASRINLTACSPSSAWCGWWHIFVICSKRVIIFRVAGESSTMRIFKAGATCSGTLAEEEEEEEEAWVVPLDDVLLPFIDEDDDDDDNDDDDDDDEAAAAVVVAAVAVEVVAALATEGSLRLMLREAYSLMLILIDVLCGC